MKVQLPEIYSQFDPRWNQLLLGYNTDPAYTINDYGCTLCNLAMIGKYYGVKCDPAQLNEGLKKLNGFKQDTGIYLSGKFAEWFNTGTPGPKLTEKFTDTPGLLTDTQMGEIKAALDAGYPVLCGIDYNPLTLKYDSHYIILVDYAREDENDFAIADPLGGRIRSLKDYLTKDMIARKSIYCYTIFSGSVPTPTISKPTETTSTPAPVVSALPPNYDDIIRKATGFDELVNKYLPNTPGVTVDVLNVAIAATVLVREKVIEKIVDRPVEVIREIKVPTTDSPADDKWTMLVTYLGIEKDPDLATYEDVRRVVAGIRSRQTDLEKQRVDTEKTIAKKDVEIKNLTDDVSRLKEQALVGDKLNKSKIESLKRATPSFDSLVKQYEGIIKNLKQDLEGATNELKDKRIEAEVGKVGLISNNTTMPTVKKKSAIIKLLDRIFRLNW
jgi:hypothetical protein